MRKCLMLYVNKIGADQPAHPRSLISTFVVRSLDSRTCILCYIQSFETLASFCGCADQFESILVANPEDTFSRDVAQIKALT